MAHWVVIDEQTPHEVDLDDRGRLDPQVLGWERKPEGLCRDDVCIPLADDVGERIELGRLAELLGRPVAVDDDAAVAALAAAPADRASALTSGLAPDVELADLDGRTHRLSDHRGDKVVLYAYASW